MHTRRWLVYVVALAAACVVSIAAHGALRWYDHPVAGVLVDPDLIVSNSTPPTWEGSQKGLGFPDRIVAIDGEDLTHAHGEFRARAWDRAIERAAREGRTQVRVRAATRTGLREIDLAIRPIDPLAWWLNAGALIFIGILYVVAALTALWASPNGALARTFAKTALLGALLLITIFDFHTTRRLVPLMQIAFAMVPMAYFALALRLPDDVSLVRKHPWTVGALDVIGLTIGFAMLARHAAGETTDGVRQLCTTVFGASQIFFVGTMVVRYLRSKAERRQTLRTLVVAMVLAHVPAGIMLLLSTMSSRGSSVLMSFLLPMLALSPLAIVVAFVRHDLWGSRALLSRVITRGVVALLTGTVAVALSAAFATSLGVSFIWAFISAAIGGIACTLLIGLALRASDQGLFPSRAKYKPTIEQLSEELTSITDTAEVARAVERTVHRWLPTERVQLQHHGGTETHSDPPVDGLGARELALPVAFGGENLGTLRLGRKRGGALYTSEDLDLLRTIANQAALALAHAKSYAELERRRQTQAAAWQQERLALVETVAAEIAHEVRYPINFFRSVFNRGQRGNLLDDEELEIGCEEVDRLERLVAGLRRLVGHRMERRSVALADLAARAEILLRDALGTRMLEVDVPGDLAVFCDQDHATQIIVNLVSNALEAANGPRDQVGFSFASRQSGGADLVVWDTGPGFEGDASQLFAPWFTTKPRGTGLGLAITQRLVRAHGWSIDATREGGTTRFVITIPASDILESSPRQTTAEVA